MSLKVENPDGTLVPAPHNLPGELFQRFDRADDDQIMAEIRGAVVQDYIYEFRQGGQNVIGLSLAGVMAVAQEMGGITCGRPIFEKDDEEITCDISATDHGRGLTVWGTSTEPRIMKTREGDRPDKFARSKALSKAQRNAIRKLIPETIATKMVEEFLAQKRGGRPASPVAQAPQRDDRINLGGGTRQPAITARREPLPVQLPPRTHDDIVEADFTEHEDLPPADAYAPPMAATAAAPRPTASGERPATEKQLNFVRALAARQGLDDDALKGLLVARCGTQHLHDLNAAEASALIEEFQGGAPATQAAPPKARPADESATDWRREMAEAPSIEALAGVANRLLQAPVSDAEREHLRQVFRERRETLLAPAPGAAPKRAPERDIPARRVNDAEMAALVTLARAKGIAEPDLDPFILKTLGARGSGGLRNLTLAACLQVQDHLTLLADR